MAKQKNASDKTITRIKASDSAKKPEKTVSSKRASKKSQDDIEQHGTIITYFKGAWSELRQVHWPTRKATWGLTGAVLAFSAFFVVFILLLDAVFNELFNQLLK